MSFNVDRCIIKQVWCGDSPAIPPAKSKNYSRVGTRRECLRKGFGAGSAIEKRKGLPADSLQNIPYIGDVMEKNFKLRFIDSISKLLAKVKPMTVTSKEVLLKSILVNKNKTLNARAYNSVVMFLYNKGILNLPTCEANA